MRSEKEFIKLCEEFSELTDPSVNLAKEVYAHFGLVFYTFALAEHTMINATHLNRLQAKFPNVKNRTQEEWSSEWERLEPVIDKLTFGVLAGEVKRIVEFVDLSDELDWATSARNYFAHNFFRNEADKGVADEGRKLLLVEMSKTRKRVQSLDEKLSKSYLKMQTRIGINPLSEEDLAKEMEKDRTAAELAINSNTVDFGWVP
jgi:hypothetical protein